MAYTQIGTGHHDHHPQLATVHCNHDRHGNGFSEAGLQLPDVPQHHSRDGVAAHGHEANTKQRLHQIDLRVDDVHINGYLDDERRSPLDVQDAGRACRAMSPHAVGGNGHACILAIARAVPPHQLMQHSFADFYFNVTNCQHMTQLKLKMQRICERSGVETRHSIMTEEFLKQHPELYTPDTPSLEQRHQILAEEVPRLAAQAAQEALLEWGRPAHHITHLVVVTLSGVAMPGADVRLVQLLGLRPSVRRVMLYMLGCYAGVTALRVAKDLAENNPGSRVLVCCSELSATTFHAPHESCPYNLVSAALFGDGAVALIIGAHPERAPPPTALKSTHAAGGYKKTPSKAAMSISSPSSPGPISRNGISSQWNGKPQIAHTTHTRKDDLHQKDRLSSNGTYKYPPSLSSFMNNIMSIHIPPCPSPGDNIPPIIRHEHPQYQSLDVILRGEHPLYEIHSAIETIIPHTENIIQGSMKVEGLEFYLDRTLPSIVSDHVASFCKDLIKDIPGESMSLQEVFWAVHPGGPAVLDAVERAANLDGHHLQASRHILSKYGNVSASSVLFVLDELRKSKSVPSSPEWGVAIAFGPGITFEGVLLKRVACNCV
ncbi:hypothetical protein GOP47_0003169 [Adiantum capillus-veneris]|uniref:Chalcone synthase n=1 Tax=Adiantum capillus-veneris TaxID=13818 RepID=A0A9D4ZRK7_ADICA|nr:hypothetical protein GOP47_0003169 [Adiantum capillus-veneris]